MQSPPPGMLRGCTNEPLRQFLCNDAYDYDRLLPRAGAPAGGTTGSLCSSIARGSPGASCSSNRRASSGRPCRSVHRHAETRGGSSSSKSGRKSTVEGRKSTVEGLARRVRDALGLLVQEPLRQLLACLNKEDELLTAASLCPLTSFLQRVLTSLQELHHILEGLNDEGHVVLLSWLTDTREELVRWGERAGLALRSLAASADAQGVGKQLHRLQDRLAETLGDIKAGQLQEQEHAETALRTEVAQLRSELQHTELRVSAAAEQGAAERRQWCQMLEGFMQVASGRAGEDLHSAKRRWRELIDDVARSHAEGQAADHSSSVWRLSEVWASQAAQRDKEVQALQRRADSALAELRQGELQAESERTKASADQQQLQLARDSAKRELQAERRAHASAVAQLQERAESDLAKEKRERASLTMQLTEALDGVASRDRSIEDLKRSLEEVVERSRCPPIPAACSPATSTAAWHAGMVVPPLPPPCDAGCGRDGAASVCRMSTESTPVGSGHWFGSAGCGATCAASTTPSAPAGAVAVPATVAAGSSWGTPVHAWPPTLAASGAGSAPGSSVADVSQASALKHSSWSPSRPWRRSVADVSTHAGETSLLTLLNTSTGSRVDGASPAACGAAPSGAAVGAASAACPLPHGGTGLLEGSDAGLRPWDLPAKDFLELWRQTRGAVHFPPNGGPPRGQRQDAQQNSGAGSRPGASGGSTGATGAAGRGTRVSVSSAAGECEVLRITTNFE